MNFLLFETFDNGHDTSLYEGLVIRGEIIKAMSAGRGKPGQDMKAIDLIRNFMLDFYSTEKEQIQFYQDYWVPLEKI